MTLEELCKKCKIRQSQRNKPPAGIPHPWMYPTAPWERVHADFVELEGQRYLIIIDAYSKWLKVYETGTSTTASRIIEVMRRVFSSHGVPRRLVTDNGPLFRSVEFKKFRKENDVKHQLTPPYHPSSNGQAERAVQIFKRSMEARPKGRTIRHQISILLLQYRSTPNTSTGKTPSELLMTRVLRTRLSLVKPTVGGEIRDRQQSQTEAASRNREMLPGESVAVWNPRLVGDNGSLDQ